MLIQSKSPNDLTENQVTAESVYKNRRTLLKQMGLGALGLGAASVAEPIFGQSLWDKFFGDDPVQAEKGQAIAKFKARALEYSNLQRPKPNWQLTPEIKAISHNNFYEFGAEKTQPAKNAQTFKVEPWTLKIDGEVDKPMEVDVWQLIQTSALQERIYRLRCVEAWSMVIPWLGLELGQLIKTARPNSRAKFVAFKSLYDPEQMPGQASRRLGGGLDYPYVEGLRIDEAMHPLTLLVVGMYGKTLPPQNGAPLRLMSPWKYGFKGIKSIVKITLQEQMPPTSWNKQKSGEYGFYANVNPEVDHPRWSQASERFIGAGNALTGTKRIPTLPFNGYAQQVASLYQGMDLRKWF